MYEIKTQAFFSAAHHLLNYDGECENQHGHNWMVEAFVQGETLNKSNILVDYKVLIERSIGYFRSQRFERIARI